jgi:hypothetical protein
MLQALRRKGIPLYSEVAKLDAVGEEAKRKRR